MRVLLAPEVFREARRARLGVLCEHGLEGRHRLQVTDTEHSDFRRWMSSLDEIYRSEWVAALETGARDDGVEPSAFEIEILNVDRSDWRLPCPRLTLGDAVALMDEKFTIFLEGDAEDRDFIRCMSMPKQERALADFENERKCLQITFGGGLEGMIKKAERDADIPWARFRRWYLFDSDGLRPGEESESSARLRQLCETAGLPFLQLRRRMIENYIPRNVLRAWVHELPRRRRRKREQLFAA